MCSTLFLLPHPTYLLSSPLPHGHILKHTHVFLCIYLSFLLRQKSFLLTGKLGQGRDGDGCGGAAADGHFTLAPPDGMTRRWAFEEHRAARRGGKTFWRAFCAVTMYSVLDMQVHSAGQTWAFDFVGTVLEQSGKFLRRIYHMVYRPTCSLHRIPCCDILLCIGFCAPPTICQYTTRSSVLPTFLVLAPCALSQKQEKMKRQNKKNNTKMAKIKEGRTEEDRKKEHGHKRKRQEKNKQGR